VEGNKEYCQIDKALQTRERKEKKEKVNKSAGNNQGKKDAKTGTTN